MFRRRLLPLLRPHRRVLLLSVLLSMVVSGGILAIPFAVLTAHPRFGRWAGRLGLCAVPDEVSVPETLRRLDQMTEAGERRDTPPQRAA